MEREAGAGRIANVDLNHDVHILGDAQLPISNLFLLYFSHILDLALRHVEACYP